MNKNIHVAMVVALLLILGFLAWPLLYTTEETSPNTTTIRLNGTPGASFTGFYVADGQRIDVSDVLPWSVSAFPITQFEFRKVDPTASLKLEIHNGPSMVSTSTGAGDLGIRGDFEGGWSVETIR